jgi:glycosyltransferase involved in cell wall biosynthesis
MAPQVVLRSADSPLVGPPERCVHPRNVLIVIDSLALGGAERCAVDMACALDRTRFVPHVLATRRLGPLEAQLEQAGIGITNLGRRHRVELAAARTTRRWMRWADVVHAHKFGSGAWCSLLHAGIDAPLLVHEHNWAGTPSRLRSFAWRHLLDRSAARTICVSESVARTVRAEGVAAERIVTLPNAVLPDVALPRAIARERLELAPHAPVFGIVAGLRPEKAHEVALEALADPRLAAAGARLCVIGRGPRAAALHELARELGVADRIDWRDSVADQLVPGQRAPVSAGAALSAAFDAAVVCSDWEGLPLFALEAMMAGTPLVTTAVGELEHVCRLDAGSVVPTRSPAALADALASVLEDPAGAARRAARARLRAETEHSFPALVARLEGLYDALCGTPAARSEGTTWMDRAA